MKTKNNHFTGCNFTIQYELERTEKDVQFVEAVEHALQHFTSEDIHTETFTDFPRLASYIRSLDYLKTYIVGNGGSHVYIHRNGEFVAGEYKHPQNQRFAIIRTNNDFFNIQHSNK